MYKILVRQCLSILCLLFYLHPAGAAEHASLLADYTHRSWSTNEGAPTPIYAIRQTPDGWLWLTTDSGLYRFDGVTFEPRSEVGGQKLRAPAVLAMETTPDGALWIGYRFGGVSRFKDGKAWHYGAAEGFPAGLPLTFAQGPDGVMWATTSNALAWLDGERWRVVGAGDGFAAAGAGISQVVFDHAGTQWVVTDAATYFRRKGERRYRVASPTGLYLNSLKVTPDGTVLGTDGRGDNYALSAAERPYALPAGQAAPVEKGSDFSRDGTVWRLRENYVERIFPGSYPDLRQRMTLDQGLSGNSPQSFFEDRDGNVWVGTLAGLDLFRPSRIRPLASAIPFTEVKLTADADGKVWVGSDDKAYLMDADGARHQTVAGHSFAAATGLNGHARLGLPDGIWTPGAQGGGTLIASPPEGRKLSPENRMRVLAQAGDGAWWASFVDAGIYRYADGHWQPARQRYPALPDARPMSMLGDSAGRFWIGYLQNRVAVIEHDRVTLLGPEQGLNVGNVWTIQERNGHLWVAGESGLARYDGRRFIPLRLADGRALRGVGGVVETAARELWFSSLDGVFHLGPEALAGFLLRGEAPAYERFGVEDGYFAPQSPIGPFPTMVESSDGRLWLDSVKGPMLIVPGTLRRDAAAPSVDILAFDAHGRHYPVGGPQRLPEGTSSLHIAYTATGAGTPRRLRFRYRLEGADDGWQDAGNRREAFYTNLAPGHYRFRVVAANRDGVWNTQGAALVIDIPPTFVQSGLFKLICALAVLAAVAMFYRWRVAQVARIIEARQSERVNERERIARALHDTFLSEVQGTILMMHGAIRQTPHGLPARAALERGISYIERALVEGRHEVMALRGDADAGEGEQLPVLLERFGQRLTAGLPLAFRVEVDGGPCPLMPEQRDEIFAIGREAIYNAFCHAEANEIVVSVLYGQERVALAVADDGKGIPEAWLTPKGRQGHWGLVGMRERAGRIGGALEINRNGAAGTRVSVLLTLPPSQAAR
jgi:signal transduction histidine kinase/ligand-binding sensor domain-containing protein